MSGASKWVSAASLAGKVFSGKFSDKDSSFGENFLVCSSIPNVGCEKGKFDAPPVELFKR